MILLAPPRREKIVELLGDWHAVDKVLHRQLPRRLGPEWRDGLESVACMASSRRSRRGPQGHRRRRIGKGGGGGGICGGSSSSSSSISSGPPSQGCKAWDDCEAGKTPAAFAASSSSGSGGARQDAVKAASRHPPECILEPLDDPLSPAILPCSRGCDSSRSRSTIGCHGREAACARHCRRLWRCSHVRLQSPQSLFNPRITSPPSP